MTTVDAALAGAIRDLAVAAGKEIMRFYGRDVTVEQKADASPVTDADRAAEDIILAGLGLMAPDIPTVAEEAVAAGRVPDISGGRFWLVDPLDGTREFISRNGEFTVNIALIDAGRPVLGTVYLPVLDQSFWTSQDGAWRRCGDGADEAITARPPPPDGLVALVSRSHRSPETDDFLARFKVTQRLDAGSSLKFCRIAEGVADLYPRLGRTMEWDIAAGHAVLAAAGGSVTTLDGAPLGYGKPGFENPHFVARGRDGDGTPAP